MRIVVGDGLFFREGREKRKIDVEKRERERVRVCVKGTVKNTRKKERKKQRR